MAFAGNANDSESISEVFPCFKLLLDRVIRPLDHSKTLDQMPLDNMPGDCARSRE